MSMVLTTNCRMKEYTPAKECSSGNFLVLCHDFCMYTGGLYIYFDSSIVTTSRDKISLTGKKSFFYVRASLTVIQYFSSIRRTLKMKRGNEQKSSTIHRLLNLLVKPIPEEKQVRSKPPGGQKFQYQLPQSFVQAVNDARIKEGYDVLPRFEHRSSLPSIRPAEKHHRSHQRKNTHAHSSTKAGVDQARGTRPKKTVPSSSTAPLSRKTASKARRRPSN